MHKDMFNLVCFWKVLNKIIHYFYQKITQLYSGRTLNSHGTLIKWPFWRNEENNVLTSSGFPDRKERPLRRENSTLETTASNLALLEHKHKGKKGWWNDAWSSSWVEPLSTLHLMTSIYVTPNSEIIKEF